MWTQSLVSYIQISVKSALYMRLLICWSNGNVWQKTEIKTGIDREYRHWKQGRNKNGELQIRKHKSPYAWTLSLGSNPYAITDLDHTGTSINNWVRSRRWPTDQKSNLEIFVSFQQGIRVMGERLNKIRVRNIEKRSPDSFLVFLSWVVTNPLTGSRP